MIRACGSKDKTVRIWDASTGKQLHVLKGHRGVVQSVAFSPDGRYVASSGGDITVRIWDPSTRDQLVAILRGRGGFVQSAAFSPDGTRIIRRSPS